MKNNRKQTLAQKAKEKAKKGSKGQRARARELGFRSGFEADIAEWLEREGVDAKYEEEVIEYTQPAKKRKYTPDFMIVSKSGKKIYIETKGRWTTEDRQKHKFIKASQPDIDIRFVFQSPGTKIRKGSKTSYADYCDKNGFTYSKQGKTIPRDWLNE